jgi:hypothetical protein
VARFKNRFGLAFQTGLAEMVYRRPWPIRPDRLVPVPVTASPTPPPSFPARAKADDYGASSI